MVVEVGVELAVGPVDGHAAVAAGESGAAELADERVVG